jgi:type II secretory pathway pseudopilin PulG
LLLANAGERNAVVPGENERRKMRKSILGFTLIEFVLWLAVAGGLAAIALPAVQ